MTKKHFNQAAEIIKTESDRNAARKMAEMIIEMNDNPRFNRCRFLAACGF